MTAASNEIPTDQQVIKTIADSGGEIAAPVLVESLIGEGHTRENVLRAIQRTLDRGKIELGNNLRLVVSQRAEAA